MSLPRVRMRRFCFRRRSNFARVSSSSRSKRSSSRSSFTQSGCSGPIQSHFSFKLRRTHSAHRRESFGDDTRVTFRLTRLEQESIVGSSYPCFVIRRTRSLRS
jgi:hypothetical protein